MGLVILDDRMTMREVTGGKQVAALSMQLVKILVRLHCGEQDKGLIMAGSVTGRYDVHTSIDGLRWGGMSGCRRVEVGTAKTSVSGPGLCIPYRCIPWQNSMQ